MVALEGLARHRGSQLTFTVTAPELQLRHEPSPTVLGQENGSHMLVSSSPVATLASRGDQTSPCTEGPSQQSKSSQHSARCPGSSPRQVWPLLPQSLPVVLGWPLLQLMPSTLPASSLTTALCRAASAQAQHKDTSPVSPSCTQPPPSSAAHAPASLSNAKSTQHPCSTP